MNSTAVRIESQADAITKLAIIYYSATGHGTSMAQRVAAVAEAAGVVRAQPGLDGTTRTMSVEIAPLGQLALARHRRPHAAGKPLEHSTSKVHLCSAATLPGTAAAGYFAARTLLRGEFGISEMPARRRV